jgi:hypothetical protein
MSGTKEKVRGSLQAVSPLESASTPVGDPALGRVQATHTGSVAESSGVSEFDVNRYAYEYLLRLRDLDNTLMWTRANIALILQAGLLAFLGSILTNLNNVNRFYGIVVAFFGLVMSMYWYRLTKGGFFWIKHWQSRMADLEPKLFGDAVFIMRKHPHGYGGALDNASTDYVSTNASIRLITQSILSFWTIVFIFMLYVILFGIPQVIRPQ